MVSPYQKRISSPFLNRFDVHAGDHPALVLAQGDDAVQIELAHARAVIAALTDAAADLAELLATGGRYHA